MVAFLIYLLFGMFGLGYEHSFDLMLVSSVNFPFSVKTNHLLVIAISLSLSLSLSLSDEKTSSLVTFLGTKQLDRL